MAHFFSKDDDVCHQHQGPQGRSDNVRSNIYTVMSRMPIEADRPIRYRIRSKTENVERVVTETNSAESCELMRSTSPDSC